MYGDDLDDDYVPDSDLVGSEEEEHGSEDKEHPHGPVLRRSPVQNDTALKKRKRRDREKEKKAKKRKLMIKQEETHQSAAILSPVDAALYLAGQQAKALPKLTALELEERRIPYSCIADTKSYTGPRTLDDIGNLITHSLPKLMARLRQKPRANGAPTLIFIAGAALRVADVTRVLKKCKGIKGGEVAKLFARHFKLQDHISYLTRTKVAVAVGTPMRLSQLLEAEALALTALTHIFIDISYRDAKRRSLMDIPETCQEVFRGVLGNENIRAAIHSGNLQLVLF